jgi:hypothetical protein
MNINKLYNEKLEETIVNQSYDSNYLKNLFLSEKNKNIISNNLYREVYLPNNQQLYNNITKIVNNPDNIKWIDNILNKSKFDDINQYNLFEHLNYLNKLFVDTFKNVITNYNTYEFEIANNPYKHTYTKNGKNDNKISDMLSTDYQHITFNNNNDKNNLNIHFNKNYNKIPYYESALYSKHMDFKDNGSFRERKLDSYNPKRYNNSELLTNVSYLSKKKSNSNLKK